ncbi:hypothetical protein EDB19DRAFT_1982320 [Suillus lakei]|nr:hypothetical protein EDB19DRAFT_1982320 [Suillus lakei]
MYSSFRAIAHNDISVYQHQVTLPTIPKLTNPNFLDVLLPVSEDASPILITENSLAHNAMMDALQSTAHHKFTENNLPAFGSTLSVTLDVFNSIHPGVSGFSIDHYLSEAWAEDPALTPGYTIIIMDNQL